MSPLAITRYQAARISLTDGTLGVSISRVATASCQAASSTAMKAKPIQRRVIGRR